MSSFLEYILKILACHKCFCQGGHGPVPEPIWLEISIIVVEQEEISIKLTKGTSVSEILI